MKNIKMGSNLHKLSKLASALLIFSVSGHVLAQQAPTGKLAAEPGFAGAAIATIGFNRTDDQFSTDDDNKVWDGQNNKGNSHTEFNLLPIVNLTYTFSSLQDQIFFGVTKENYYLGRIAAPELGYRHIFDNKTVAQISVFDSFSIYQTWKNPFLTGQDRSKTDDTYKGITGKLDNIYNSGIGITFIAGKRDVDKEQSPNPSIMSRDSNFYYTELSYLTKLNEAVTFRVGGNYTKNNADGSARSFNRYALNATLGTNFASGTIASTIMYASTNYDDKIDVVNLPNKKEKDNTYGINLNYTYPNLFGVKKLFGSVNLDYKYNSSNIDFYEYSSLGGFFGIGYSF